MIFSSFKWQRGFSVVVLRRGESHPRVLNMEEFYLQLAFSRKEGDFFHITVKEHLNVSGGFPSSRHLLLNTSFSKITAIS